MSEEGTAIDVPQLVRDAVKRTKGYLSPSPLEYSPCLSELIEGEVYLKLDIMLKTGSFKYRGAINSVLALTEEQLNRGIIAASTGNFALAFAEAMRLRGHAGTVFVGEDLEPDRLKLLRSRGLDLVIHGDAAGAETEARRVAGETGKVYISPYNDPIVIGGQGICGMEISEQLPEVDAVFVAIGGGGYISGISGYLKDYNPNIEIVGLNPANSPAMARCIEAGELIDIDYKLTIADTCLGNVEKGAITFDIIKKNVDEIMLLTEDEIANAVRYVFEEHKLVVEGSAAMSVAALMKNTERYKGKKVVLTICGRNIGTELFKKIIA